MKLYFICSDFFNYDKSIKKELERIGYDVELITEYPFGGKFIKVLNRLFHGKLNFIFSSYYKKKFENLDGDNIVFIIKGETLSKTALNNIFNKTKRVCIYQWDALKNNCNSKCLLKYSEFITSFDPVDTCKYKLRYKALFHQMESFNQHSDREKNVGASFIGTVHEDRLKQLIEIETYLKKEGVSFFFYKYYPSKLIFFLRKIIDTRLWGVNTKDVFFKPLEYSKYKEIIANSISVIDFPRKAQSGYTMRTIESLASNTKVITTAEYLEDKFCLKGDAIFHLNESNKAMLCDFLLRKSEFSLEDFNELKLKNWLKDILE